MNVLLSMLLLGIPLFGCAGKVPDSTGNSGAIIAQSPETEYQQYLKAFAQREKLFREAIVSDNPVAPVFALNISPASPKGTVQPFGNLKIFILRIPPFLEKEKAAPSESQLDDSSQ